MVFKTSFSPEGNIEEFIGNPVIFFFTTQTDYQLGDTLNTTIRFAAIREFDFEARLIKFSNEEIEFIDSLDIDHEWEAPISYILTEPGDISLGVQYEVNHHGFHKKNVVVIPTLHVKERG
ncbi:MAG: hypothetical protein ABJN36_17845 [Cyclobacteriaceae bacterium]